MKILHIGPVKPRRDVTGPSNSVRRLAAAQADIGLDVGLLNRISGRLVIVFEKLVIFNAYYLCMLKKPNE
jgi:hypothetical protein